MYVCMYVCCIVYLYICIKVDTNELQNRQRFLAGEEGAGWRKEDAGFKSLEDDELSHVDVLSNLPTMVDVQVVSLF